MSGKSPLDQFYKDCLRVGSLKVCHQQLRALLCRTLERDGDLAWGPNALCCNAPLLRLTTKRRAQCFTHFHLYLKGREELVVTVFTGPQTSPRNLPPFRAIASGWVVRRRPTRGAGHVCVLYGKCVCLQACGMGGSWLGKHMPMPACTWGRMRACRSGNAFPPASPANHELDVHNPDVTVFLIGAYAKYNWPYVWVRRLGGRGVAARCRAAPRPSCMCVCQHAGVLVVVCHQSRKTAAAAVPHALC